MSHTQTASVCVANFCPLKRAGRLSRQIWCNSQITLDNCSWRANLWPYWKHYKWRRTFIKCPICKINGGHISSTKLAKINAIKNGNVIKISEQWSKIELIVPVNLLLNLLLKSAKVRNMRFSIFLTLTSILCKPDSLSLSLTQWCVCVKKKRCSIKTDLNFFICRLFSIEVIYYVIESGVWDRHTYRVCNNTCEASSRMIEEDDYNDDRTSLKKRARKETTKYIITTIIIMSSMEENQGQDETEIVTVPGFGFLPKWFYLTFHKYTKDYEVIIQFPICCWPATKKYLKQAFSRDPLKMKLHGVHEQFAMHICTHAVTLWHTLQCMCMHCIWHTNLISCLQCQL